MNRSEFLRRLAILGSATVAGCATEGARKPGPVIRVMTYNIHHGVGRDGALDLLRIATVINESKCDLVALQEVDRGVERTGRRDLLKELAHHTSLTPFFAKNVAIEGGEYGNAILSRFPIKRSSNLQFRPLAGGEQRGLLQTVVDVEGQEVVFLSTHLDHRADDAERRASVKDILKAVAAYRNLPVILGGDFNDRPGSRFDVEMNEHFKDVWRLAGTSGGGTFPGENPDKRIDYLWIKGPVKALDAAVVPGEGSDHLAVRATLQLT